MRIAKENIVREKRDLDQMVSRLLEKFRVRRGKDRENKRRVEAREIALKYNTR